MDLDNNPKEGSENCHSNGIINESSTVIVSGGHVFYNPVQEFNRDLSIAVLNVYSKRVRRERAEKLKRLLSNSSSQPRQESNSVPLTNSKEDPNENEEYKAGQKYEDGMVILEALAATGLRSIRYAKEVLGVKRIIANDLSAQAVKCINENVKHNQVDHLVESSHSDAMTLMYLSSGPDKNFDVIDLDPYGSPSRFLDGAVQSIANGGLLLITATDMAVLAGNMPEAGYAKYGSVPLRIKSCHEMALRILLHCIQVHANRYGKYIEPLLSVSVDFYIRVFVRVYSGPSKCKYNMSKQSLVYNCTGCDTFTLQPLGVLKPNPSQSNPKQIKFGIPTGPPVTNHCKHCNHTHHLGGPIWSAPIHDVAFIEEVLDEVQNEPLCKLGTVNRITGMLTVVKEELHDVPLYYSMDKLCNVLKLEIVPMLKFRSVLLHEGYRVSYSHAMKMSIKTDAPAEVIWDILRCWNKRNPVKEKRLIDGTPLKEILSKPCQKEYNFDEIHPMANPPSRRLQLTRYQTNPKAFWGPGTRATIMSGEQIPKSVRNQNKKQKMQSNSTNEKDCEMKSQSEELQGNLSDEVKTKQAKLEA